MVLFALSFQGQVEKYGVYVGIAAFFGLAVLSLLYFSQARELKRLREWAGRAPERAQELEQRVVAQAAANVTRRGPAMPGAQTAAGAIAPPRRLAEMPPPAAGAQAAAGGQATELADAVEADEPATNGNVPAAPGAGMAGGANGSAPPADDEAAAGEAAKPAGEEQPEGEPAAEAAPGEQAADEQAADEAAAGEPPEAPAEPAADERAPEEPAETPDREPEPASTPAG